LDQISPHATLQPVESCKDKLPGIKNIYGLDDNNVGPRKFVSNFKFTRQPTRQQKSNPKFQSLKSIKPENAKHHTIKPLGKKEIFNTYMGDFTTFGHSRQTS
jgi:hypothetical protein